MVVTGEGFRWRDQEYPSLTAIARLITGTNWNGPRFFGLRMAHEGAGASAALERATGKKRDDRGPKKAQEARP